MRIKHLFLIFLIFFTSCGSSDSNSYVKRGDFCYEKGEPERAIKLYTYALIVDSLNFNAYYNRSIVYVMKGNNDLALADLSKAIKIRPNDYNSFIQRGLIFQKQRKYSLSINDFGKAIDINPSIELYMSRSSNYIMTKSYDKALSDMNAAIKIAPKHSELYFNRASIYIMLGNNYKIDCPVAK